jgi:uncharacterized protein YuzE
MTFREFEKALRITCDAEADAAYIYLRPIAAGGVAQTIPVDVSPLNGSVNLDVDSNGRIIGIEIIGASALLPEELLGE